MRWSVMKSNQEPYSKTEQEEIILEIRRRKWE
jgi:hypothetical protein